MSNPSLIYDRLRIKLGKGIPFVDSLTGSSPTFVKGTDIVFEVGIFFNNQPVDVTQYASITIEIRRGNDISGLSVMSKTLGSASITPNAGMTLADWQAGTGYHAQIAFTHSDTNIAFLDAQDGTESFFAILTATTTPGTGSNVVLLGSGAILISEEGVSAAPFAPIVGGNIIPLGAVYDGSGKYYVTLVDNSAYDWTKNANDTSIVNGAQTLTTTSALITTLSTKSVSSITHVTTTATVTSASHGFTNGQHISIAGAVQSQYNGIFVISGVAANTFQYTMASDPGVDATGTITAALAIILNGTASATVTATLRTSNYLTAAQSVGLFQIQTDLSALTASDAAKMPLAGGTFSGDVVFAATKMLTLSSDPTANFHAVTKQWVVNNYITSTAAMPKSGGTFTGAIVLSADPAAALQPVSLQYFQAHGLVRDGNAGQRTMTGELFLDTTVGSTPTADNVAVAKVYITAQVTALIGGATSGGNTLKKLEDRLVDSLQLTGGTLTGSLFVPSGDPSSATQVPNKAYVDKFVKLTGGSAGIMTGLLSWSGTTAGIRLSGLANASGLTGISGGELFYNTTTATPYFYTTDWFRLVMADGGTGDINAARHLLLPSGGVVKVNSQQVVAGRNATAVNALTGSLTGTLDLALADVAFTLAALTGSLTGTLDGAMADSGSTSGSDQSAVINKNFANVKDKINSLATQLATAKTTINKDLANLQNTVNLILNRIGHTNGHGLISSNA